MSNIRELIVKTLNEVKSDFIIVRENLEDNDKQLVFEIIDEFVEGADLYSYDDSIWLILTDEKVWIFQFEDDGDVWYNYNFFQTYFNYMSLDVNDNKKYMIDWVKKYVNKEIIRIASVKRPFSIMVDEVLRYGKKIKTP
jgi:hypothetical protein